MTCADPIRNLDMLMTRTLGVVLAVALAMLGSSARAMAAPTSPNWDAVGRLKQGTFVAVARSGALEEVTGRLVSVDQGSITVRVFTGDQQTIPREHVLQVKTKRPRMKRLGAGLLTSMAVALAAIYLPSSDPPIETPGVVYAAGAAWAGAGIALIAAGRDKIIYTRPGAPTASLHSSPLLLRGAETALVRGGLRPAAERSGGGSAPDPVDETTWELVRQVLPPGLRGGRDVQPPSAAPHR